MTDAQAALESLEHMCRFLEDEHGFRRGGSKIAQDLALVRQEIERLEDARQEAGLLKRVRLNAHTLLSQWRYLTAECPACRQSVHTADCVLVKVLGLLETR